MKSKILVLMVLASAPLLFGCKSEEDKFVENACDIDLSEHKNREVCEEALSSNCGGHDLYFEASHIQSELLGLERKKKLLRGLPMDEKLKEEEEVEYKSKKKSLQERWDELPMSSTCKNTVVKLVETKN